MDLRPPQDTFGCNHSTLQKVSPQPSIIPNHRRPYPILTSILSLVIYIFGLAGPHNHPVAKGQERTNKAAEATTRINNADVDTSRPIVVNSKQTTIGNDGLCTLNEAVINANNDAQTHKDCRPGVGKDLIHFKIPGPGPHMLHLRKDNHIKIESPLVIDGMSQKISGMSPASCGKNRNLVVGLTGISAGESSGLIIFNTEDVTIRGLVINAFKGSGIHVTKSRNVHIACMHIGTNFEGDTAIPNWTSGIQVSQDSEFVTIGTNSDGVEDIAEFNVISGNGSAGIMISKSHNNVVAGNLIGTTLNGLTALPNNGHGIMLMRGSTYNRIGTSANSDNNSLDRNVISGNKTHGITISDAGTRKNSIRGNFVGTNIFGSRKIPNQVAGINVTTGASGTKIGGRNSSDRNVISGNGSRGVWIHATNDEFVGGSETSHTIVQNNFIGLDNNGQPLGNNNQGVLVELAADVQLIDNSIADNLRRGVYIRGAEVMLVNNRIFDNQLSGIEVTFHPGSTANLLDELTSQDDVISSIRILGNLIYGNCVSGRRCAGILGIDDSIAPNDKTKGKMLARANIIKENHGRPDIAQYWYVAIQPTADRASPQAQYTLHSTVGNGAYALTPTAGNEQKRVSRRLFGPPGFTLSDVATWYLLSDFTVAENGTHIEHTYSVNKGEPAPFAAEVTSKAYSGRPQFEATGLRTNIHIGYTQSNNAFSLLRYKVLELRSGE